MSLETAIQALAHEKDKLLREAKVIDEAITMIRGVTPSTPPAAPAPNGQTAPTTAGLAVGEVITGVLRDRGLLTLAEICAFVREVSGESRPAIVEAGLYELVKDEKVDFHKGGRYGLSSQRQQHAATA